MLHPQAITLLRQIVVGTQSPAQCFFANPRSPIARMLVKDNFVTENSAMVDPADAAKIAFRATPAGYAALPIEDETAVNTPNAAGLTPTDGVVVTQVAERKRGGSTGPRGPRIPPAVAPHTSFRFAAIPEGVKHSRTAGPGPGESYPFSKLLPPDDSGLDSFFVQPTEQQPSPFKLVRQATNSANKRNKDKGQSAQFKAVDMPSDPEYNIAGVRVFRVA